MSDGNAMLPYYLDSITVCDYVTFYERTKAHV
jgi:hypothetical protein